MWIAPGSAVEVFAANFQISASEEIALTSPMPASFAPASFRE
jgi:hypothetical protein